MVKFPDLPAVQKEWCEESHVYFTPAETKFTPAQMKSYAEETFYLSLDKESIDQVIADCEIAKVGSCNCLTKTPDIEYHKAHCRYRCLSSAINKLRSLIEK